MNKQDRQDQTASFGLPRRPAEAFQLLGDVLMSLLRHARADEKYQQELLWRAAQLSIALHEEVERIDRENLGVLDDLRLEAEWVFPVCDGCPD